MEESLKDKYNRLLREGRVDEATRLVNSDGEVENDFTSLEGVGPSLADDLKQVFNDFEDLRSASVSSLTQVNGVGVKTAENLKKQVSK